MSLDRKKPLYRKVNTRTHGVRHGRGGDFRHQRNTKKQYRYARNFQAMRGDLRHGRDYTPLFKFLLSKVGEDWTDVHSEAVARLDTPDPIFWMVALREQDKFAMFGVGESSYFSGLYVDADNRLRVSAPELTVETLEPTCPCCTHTLNGVPFTKPYVAPDVPQVPDP